ncbi:vWA domain-containing protein [Pelagicoccus mobilis]|uniref:VWA domain-containing protein n=1 Tax=Pelagicoccus mobilis TaxID=415221 RepID=A0A934RUY9_9BACT|nr:VWA domain-containing protein [Pelagicoccus mobilis]MBK1877307.1 VWA domain-containing protein [Pelagicoccus mobilis]
MPDWSVIDNFHFLRPWWLLAFLPMLIALATLRRQQDARAQWQNIVAPHLLEHLIVKGRQKKSLTPLGLTFIACILAILALAGPSWKRSPSPFYQDEAPLVIAVDVSFSMEQNDIQPTRLERAKQKIQDLLKSRGAAPTGLIAYSGSAHIVIPLTDDPEIVVNLLSAITPKIMPIRGKEPKNVLPLANRILNGSSAPGTLLLITDGVESSGIQSYASYFSSQEHQLIVWGIGTSTRPNEKSVPKFPLQEEELKDLANRCGGHYQQLSIDASDARNVQRKTKSYLVTAEDEFSPWVDEGYYFAIPMAFLITVWFRKGWTLSWE